MKSLVAVLALIVLALCGGAVMALDHPAAVLDTGPPTLNAPTLLVHPADAPQWTRHEEATQAYTERSTAGLVANDTYASATAPREQAEKVSRGVARARGHRRS